VSFTVTTLKKSTPQAVTITAAYNETSRTASVQVNAPTPTSSDPLAHLRHGRRQRHRDGHHQHRCPGGGQPVATLSNSLFASVPSSVTVAAGATTATFTVSTLPIESTRP
jgi:hypothetical protein